MPKTPRPSKRVMSLAAAAAVGASAVIGFAAPVQAAQPTTIQLLSINDFHGRIANDEGTPEKPTAPPIPGAAKLFGLIDSLRDDMPTGVVAAGDLIGASTFESAIQQDEPTIEVMNAGGLNVSSVGNHEFDKGFADLTQRVIPSAQFPYLGANVYLDGRHALDSYSVQDVGGISVGYVGVVTVQTPTLVSPAGIAGLSFTDPVDEANRVSAQLKDGDPSNGEADVVVLLAHEGAATASVQGGCLGVYDDSVFTRFAKSSAAIDAIISGHTHMSYAFQMPVPGMAKTRPVIQASSYSMALGRITLSYDGNTVTSSTAELLDPITAAPDPAIAAIVDEATAESKTLGAQPVGTVVDSFPAVADRGLEYPTSNLVATAQLAGTANDESGNAQLAFTNPGGVRTGLTYAQAAGEGDGVVTYSEAFAVQPFANDVVTISMTGAQIIEALEQQVQPLGASRAFLHLGVSANFSYEYNYRATAGNVLGELQVVDPLLDGAPLEPGSTYRVTVNAFLAAGGDNFPAFTRGGGLLTSGQNDIAQLVQYLQDNPGLDPADFGPFSTFFETVPGGEPGTPSGPPPAATPADCPAAVATAAVTLSAGAVEQGSTIIAVGTDFAPYETVTAALYSEPLAIGAATADEFGVVQFEVVLSQEIAPGDHSLRLVGLGSDIDVSATFQVEALPQLAATGAHERQALALGITLVLLGCAALYLGRRRRFDFA